MGVNFGAHLRAQRRARGLNQAQLCGTYPPSYISLLEIGRREPTPEVIEQLARQLRLAPETLESWNAGPTPEDAGYILAALAARQAWDVRDYPEAARQAATAAEHATAAGDRSGWWDSAYLQAESLMKLGEHARARNIVEGLLHSDLTSGSDALTVRAHQMLAALCHGLGHLDAALAHARTAVQASAALPAGSPFAVAALNSLAAALAEADRLEEAWEHCRTLEAHAADESLGQMAGEAEWTIGNVAFIRGDPDEGARHHERAARLLSPANDLHLWARFNKASAAARLTGGIIDPETLAALQRAETAYSITTSSTPAEQLELALARAHWHHLNHEHTEALEHLEKIHAHRHILGHSTAAEAAHLHGRTLAILGDDDRVSALLRKAHHQYTAAGLPEKARQSATGIEETLHAAETGPEKHRNDPKRAIQQWTEQSV